MPGRLCKIDAVGTSAGRNVKRRIEYAQETGISSSVRFGHWRAVFLPLQFRDSRPQTH